MKTYRHLPVCPKCKFGTPTPHKYKENTLKCDDCGHEFLRDLTALPKPVPAHKPQTPPEFAATLRIFKNEILAWIEKQQPKKPTQ